MHLAPALVDPGRGPDERLAVARAAAAAGERRVGRQWPGLPATVCMQFSRNGNRSNYGALSFARRSALADLVIAECHTADGRFLDDIIDGIWCICEESFWGCLLYTSPSPRDRTRSRMPSSA